MSLRLRRSSGCWQSLFGSYCAGRGILQHAKTARCLRPLQGSAGVSAASAANSQRVRAFCQPSALKCSTSGRASSVRPSSSSVCARASCAMSSDSIVTRVVSATAPVARKRASARRCEIGAGAGHWCIFVRSRSTGRQIFTSRQARDAEVEHLDLPFAGEHHVFWLQVPVHHARGVCDSQGICKSHRDAVALAQRQGFGAHIAEPLPVDIFEDQIVPFRAAIPRPSRAWVRSCGAFLDRAGWNTSSCCSRRRSSGAPRS